MGHQLPHHTGARGSRARARWSRRYLCGPSDSALPGTGVRETADYKHLNNNTTTQADASPPGRRGKTSLGKIHLKNTKDEE